MISVDSMQVYRGMDIGTAKPTVTERRGVPHHLIDVAEPEEEFTVAEFGQLGRDVMTNTDAPLIICGGSGLHFRALVDPMTFAPTDELLRAELEGRELDELVADLILLDPGAGDHVDLANRRRVIRALEVATLTGETPTTRAESNEADEVRRFVPRVEFTAVGVDPGPGLDDRIARRLEDMRMGGLVEEVESIQGRLGRTAANAVGYREIVDHLAGRLSLDDAFRVIGQNTKRLARRQRTWFQRDPRVRWIPWMDAESDRVDSVMEIVS